jgi:hypothetical protein
MQLTLRNSWPFPKRKAVQRRPVLDQLIDVKKPFETLSLLSTTPSQAQSFLEMELRNKPQIQRERYYRLTSNLQKHLCATLNTSPCLRI